jgi:hypothetical protein
MGLHTIFCRFARRTSVYSTLWLLIVTFISSACSGPAVYRTTAGVHLAGRIDDSSYQRLAELLTPGDSLILDSDGGYVTAAGRMAALVISLHADTHVDDRCASACALVFAAGHHRTAGPEARIGVHQSTGSPEVDVVFENTLRALGTPPAVVEAMQRTPSRSIYWVSEAQLRAWIN